MCENQCITNYLVNFMEHAMHSGWNDTALMHTFYDGLADHIKEALTNRPRPQNLQQLREYARDCDMRYWTRYGEKGRPQAQGNTMANQSSTSSYPQQRPQAAQQSSAHPNNSGCNPPDSGSSCSNTPHTQQANAGQQTQTRPD